MRCRVGIVLLLVATLSVSVLVTPAPAAALPGPSQLGLGLVDDLLFKSPAVERPVWLGRARGIGAGYVRITVWWSEIAPNTRPRHFNPSNPGDPSYQWSTIDAAVRTAAAHGERVVLTVLGAPPWAHRSDVPAGVDPVTWFPNPGAYGQFAHAIGLRYSGRFPDPLQRGRKLSRVGYFQAWNEPNLPTYLMPQWARTRGGAWQAVSPGLYRGLLNAFYGGVKSARHDDVVLSAGTAPYGDPPGTGAGRMAPVTFLDGLFCLTRSLRPAPCRNPVHLDAADHHPYGLTPTAKTPGHDDVGVVDLYKVRRVLEAAERYRHVLPAGPKPLWVTEVDWTSAGAGYTPAVQARYLALGFYELWSQGASHVFWYEFADTNNLVDTGASFASAGLFYEDGVPKPAAAAYKFPFVALSTRQRKLVLWGRAPQGGTVVVEQLVRGRWRRFAVLRTTSGGIFYQLQKPPRTPQPRYFRALIGRNVSPIWANG